MSLMRLDAVSKRQIVVAVFFLLQSIKLHQLFFPFHQSTRYINLFLTPSSSSEFLFLQWTFLDISFVLFLHWAKIPKLTLSPLITFSTAFAFCILNAGLIGRMVEKRNETLPSSSSPISEPSSFIPSVPEIIKEKVHASSHDHKMESDDQKILESRKENAQYQDTQNLNEEQMKSIVTQEFQPLVAISDEEDEEEFQDYIQGSFTVHLVAPAIATLNPNANKFCLKDGNTLQIPMSITGQGPWTLFLERIDNQGVERTLPELIIRKNEDGSIPPLLVDQIGIYKLKRVLDHIRNIEGKVKSAPVTIAQCPEADIVLEDKAPLHRCENDLSDVPLIIQAKGSFPLTVEYSIIHELDVSPTIQRIRFDEDDVSMGNGDTLSSYTVDTLETTVTIRKVGKSEIKLNKVIDRFGNQMDLNQNAEGTVSSVSSVIIHPLPSVNLLNQERLARFKLKIGSYSNVQVPVHLTGVGPWDVNLLNQDDGGDMIKPLTFVFNDRDSTLTLAEEGHYIINKVSDQYCNISFDPNEGVEFWVDKVDPPQLAINKEVDQLSSCLSSSTVKNSIDVAIEMKGLAPFWVDYEIENVESKKIRYGRFESSKNTYSLHIEPEESGKFSYKFNKIGDADYPAGVELSRKMFSLSVQTKSDAFIESSDPITICKQDKVHIPVRLNGTSPWQLSYSLIKQSKRKHKIDYVLKRIEENKIELELDDFDESGDFFISLGELTDANGCSWSLGDKQNAQISVLKDRPSAKFISDSPVFIKEGEKANLKLKLTGTAPFHLTYLHLDSQQEFALNTNDANPTLSLEHAGGYAIHSISDRFCSGELHQPNELIISKIPLPSVKILNEYQRSAHKNEQLVCQYDTLDLVLQLQGQSPFNVLMAMHADQNPVTTKVIQSNEERTFVSLDTSITGQHWVQINQISDKSYRDISLDKDPVLFKYNVFQLPAISVVDKEIYHQCLHEKTDESSPIGASSVPAFSKGVQFTLSGQIPFNVEFELLNDQGQLQDTIKLVDIQDYKAEMMIPSFNQTGVYSVYLKSLKDGNECSARIGTPKHLVNIHVTENAKITPLIASSDMCAGDRLTYSLQGSGPFKVDTKFTSTASLAQGSEEISIKTTQVQDPILTLYAKKPGLVQIVQVCDRFGCCSQPDNMSSMIHPLPKVKVAGGQRLEKDLREGDQTEIEVSLEGTPPFTLTLAKKALSSKTKAAEVLKVENIQTHTHMIPVSDEGEFFIKSVKDNYCSFPSLHHKSKQHRIANVVAE